MCCVVRWYADGSEGEWKAGWQCYVQVGTYRVVVVRCEGRMVEGGEGGWAQVQKAGVSCVLSCVVRAREGGQDRQVEWGGRCRGKGLI